MNKALSTIIIILSVLSLNGQTDTSQMEITIWDTIVYEKTKNYPIITEETLNDELAGVFFTNNLLHFDSIGISRTKNIQIEMRTYKLNFKKNGNCEWKDLTKKYKCGNAIWVFEKIKFKKEGDFYNIRFMGYQKVGQVFDFNGLYKLTNNETGLCLKLVSVIHDK